MKILHKSPGHWRLVPINAVLKISPHGKGSSDSKYAECRRTHAIRIIKMDECAGARRVSGLVAAGCSDLNFNLATARF